MYFPAALLVQRKPIFSFTRICIHHLTFHCLMTPQLNTQTNFSLPDDMKSVFDILFKVAFAHSQMFPAMVVHWDQKWHFLNLCTSCTCEKKRKNITPVRGGKSGTPYSSIWHKYGQTRKETMVFLNKEAWLNGLFITVVIILCLGCITLDCKCKIIKLNAPPCGIYFLQTEKQVCQGKRLA